MKFKEKLLEGRLLQRYKRFFADVEWKNKTYTIHVANTGSLKGVIDKSLQQRCLFSLHGDLCRHPIRWMFDVYLQRVVRRDCLERVGMTSSLTD